MISPHLHPFQTFLGQPSSGSESIRLTQPPLQQLETRSLERAIRTKFSRRSNFRKLLYFSGGSKGDL
jgi:hypothetical protein